MPLYARYGVRHAWLIDPLARRLEAYALENSDWESIASFGDGERICAAPFEAVTLESPWS